MTGESPFSTKATSEIRHGIRGDLPDLTGIDAVIVMREQDPQRRDVAPIDLRVPGFELVGQRRARLADDLQQAFCSADVQGSSEECRAPVSDNERKLIGRIENVGDPLVVRSTHRGRASRRM